MAAQKPTVWHSVVAALNEVPEKGGGGTVRNLFTATIREIVAVEVRISIAQLVQRVFRTIDIHKLEADEHAAMHGAGDPSSADGGWLRKMYDMDVPSSSDTVGSCLGYVVRASGRGYIGRLEKELATQVDVVNDLIENRTNTAAKQRAAQIAARSAVGNTAADTWGLGTSETAPPLVHDVVVVSNCMAEACKLLRAFHLLTLVPTDKQLEEVIGMKLETGSPWGDTLLRDMWKQVRTSYVVCTGDDWSARLSDMSECDLTGELLESMHIDYAQARRLLATRVVAHIVYGCIGRVLSMQRTVAQVPWPIGASTTYATSSMRKLAEARVPSGRLGCIRHVMDNPSARESDFFVADTSSVQALFHSAIREAADLLATDVSRGADGPAGAPYEDVRQTPGTVFTDSTREIPPPRYDGLDFAEAAQLLRGVNENASAARRVNRFVEMASGVIPLRLAY